MSTPTSSSTPNSLPTDPLLALGPSLFLTTLSFLPVQSVLAADSVSRSWRRTIAAHSRGVWRACSWRSGVELGIMRTMKMIEDAPPVQAPSVYYDPDMDMEEAMFEPNVSVDWRDVCKTHVTLQNNWRRARCRARYLTPPNNTVWRIKVDHEQSTMLCTSRISGLTVIDMKDSRPLFTIRGVRGWAHLEHARGLVVFDTDRNDDEFSLEVWRTQNAIDRSSHSPSSTGSTLSSSLISFTHPTFDRRSTTARLPRGHLQYFRTITPPTPCLAFRVHTDRADEEGKETPVLATAGEEGVYIWDLDDESKMERLDIVPADRARVRYIELDDEFVFICGDELKIYSRDTKSKLLSLPSSPEAQQECAGLLFSLRVHDDDSPFGPASTTSDDVQREVLSPVGAAEVESSLRADTDFEDKFSPVPMEDQALLIDVVHHFTACHFTTTDLVCASTAGLLIIRDYSATLKEVAAMTEADRPAGLARKSIFLTFGDPVQQLTTYHDHIVVTTDKGHVVTLDASALPLMPYSPASTGTAPSRRPTLLAHTLLGHSLASTVQSSCLQADRTSIYLTLWTLAPRRGVEVGVPNGECGVQPVAAVVR